jgi:hypothetical protein
VVTKEKQRRTEEEHVRIASSGGIDDCTAAMPVV